MQCATADNLLICYTDVNHTFTLPHTFTYGRNKFAFAFAHASVASKTLVRFWPTPRSRRPLCHPLSCLLSSAFDNRPLNIL